MVTSIPYEYLALGLVMVLGIALLQRLPVIGGLIRLVITVGLVSLALYMLTERAAFDPVLAKIADRLHLDRQEVVGTEVRIPLAPNGHFLASVTINGVKRRMLVDSGATVTAISDETAAAAGINPDTNLLPVTIQTANGAVPARTATISELRIGNVVARDLKVVISPAFGPIDVVGMNFLSKLKSWRVEDGTLVLVPHHPQKVAA
jgi:aspartyl protease family protein